jgi:hypothetical protein
MATVPELWGLEFSGKKFSRQAGYGISDDMGLQLLEAIEPIQT